MEEKITCKKVLISWLQEHDNTIIAHHIIDSELYEYGKEMFGAYHSPASYHRNWCWLKNDSELLRENGIEIETIVEGHGKINRWKIKLIEQLKMELK